MEDERVAFVIFTVGTLIIEDTLFLPVYYLSNMPLNTRLSSVLPPTTFLALDFVADGFLLIAGSEIFWRMLLPHHGSCREQIVDLLVLQQQVDGLIGILRGGTGFCRGRSLTHLMRAVLTILSLFTIC